MIIPDEVRIFKEIIVVILKTLLRHPSAVIGKNHKYISGCPLISVWRCNIYDSPKGRAVYTVLRLKITYPLYRVVAVVNCLTAYPHRSVVFKLRVCSHLRWYAKNLTSIKTKHKNGFNIEPLRNCRKLLIISMKISYLLA
jgi:hypothetical protein